MVGLTAPLDPRKSYEPVSGIRSSQSTTPELRSFSVETAPPSRVLPCEENGMFALKLGVGERELIVCPAGCAAHVNGLVFGSGKLRVFSPKYSTIHAALSIQVSTAPCPLSAGQRYMTEPW